MICLYEISAFGIKIIIVENPLTFFQVFVIPLSFVYIGDNRLTLLAYVMGRRTALTVNKNWIVSYLSIFYISCLKCALKMFKYKLIFQIF